jgi:hypothetical protein
MTRRRLSIDHGENGTLPSRRINARQIGTSYVWVGSTGKLIEILNPGDPGYEENAKLVAAAMRPNGATSR